MPLFDIHCDSCGYEWEDIMRDSKSQTGTCPKCGSAFTRVVWRQGPVTGGTPHPGEDAYRHLDKAPPDPKLFYGPPKGGWKSGKKAKEIKD